MKEINNYAFYTAGIKYLTLPERISSVGIKVFAKTDIETTDIPENFTLGSEMFAGCQKLHSVNLLGSHITIPERCFCNCINLTEIDITKTAFIKNEAFCGCQNLSVSTIPADTLVSASAFEETGVTDVVIEDISKIDNRVFADCKSLKKLTINVADGPTSVPSALVKGCENLQTVMFTGRTQNLTVIEAAAFKETKNLNTVSLPDTIKTISKEAFYHSAIQNIHLPENLKQIGIMAFAGNGLKNIVIPNKTKRLGYYAFRNCKELTEVTLPEKLKTIGRQTFSESVLKSITLPDSVEFTETECFRDCYNLEEVTLPAKEFVVPDGMFMNCTALKKVNNADKIVQLGKYAFYGANSLKQVDLSSAVNIGGSAFECSGLTSVKLSKCCTTLDMNAFYKCKSLKLADLSESSIEYFAPYIFYRCGENKLMTEVILPDKVWNVDECAFIECYIKNLNVTADVSWKNVMISENAFADTNIDTLTFADNPDGHVYLNESAFKNAFIGELTIPDYLYDKYKNVWDNVNK